MIKEFCEWLAATPLSQDIQDAFWVIPTVQTVHIVSIAIVMTSMAMCFVLIPLAIRLYVRVPNRTWKTEDNIFAGAAVRLRNELWDLIGR